MNNTYNGIKLTSGVCRVCKASSRELLPEGYCVDCGEDQEDVDYLNECIKKGTETWKDVPDTDKWLNEIRGYE